MTTAYSNLISKLRAAATGLCAAKQPTFAVFDGGAVPAELNRPYGVCYAENSNEEDPPDTGTFWLDFKFEWHGNAPQDVDGVNSKTPYDLAVQTMFDVFMQDDLYQQLNAVGIANFTANGVRTRATDFQDHGDEWVTTLSMQILCSPSTLYP